MKNQILITPIEKKEIDQAAKLCAEAFISTPFTSIVMGGQSKKSLKNLTLGMKIILKSKGEVFVARESDKLVGVLRMVKWPDCQKSTPRGIVAFLGRIFGGQGFRNMLHFRKIWATYDPKEVHWHIDPLCILPEKQGQGIGSQLMAFYCEKVDKDGMLAYHETDQKQNERLYERFGFKTEESENIFGIKHYFMWRRNK